VVIGRWLVAGFRTLLCFDPTRGIDIQTKREIYTLLRELAANGAAILLYTSELAEILTRLRPRVDHAWRAHCRRTGRSPRQRIIHAHRRPWPRTQITPGGNNHVPSTPDFRRILNE
jgi:ABC-type microcin C transport system duplicated ATPase subunit YejF